MGQITVCRCYEETVDGCIIPRILILANTHLFYHPSAAFVRLLQTDAIVRTILHIRDRIKTDGLMCLDDIVINGEEAISPPTDIKSESDCNMMRVGHNMTEDDTVIDTTLSMRGPFEDIYSSSSPPPVSVIIMGDFNSTPETAVIEYFHK